MGLIDRLLGVRKAPIVVPRENIVEIDYDEDVFNNAVRQAEDVARNNVRGGGERRVEIEVVIRVSNDNRKWTDFEVFDSGRRGSGVRLPSMAYLREVGRRTGKRYVNVQKRATI